MKKSKRLRKIIQKIVNRIGAEGWRIGVDEYGDNVIVCESMDVVHKVEKCLDKLIDLNFRSEEGYLVEAWHEEYFVTCDQCDEFRVCIPQHHGWRPKYIEYKGDYLCDECAIEEMDKDDWLDYLGRASFAIPEWLDVEEKFGWQEVEYSLAAGHHIGQNDDPKKLARLLVENGVVEFGFAVYPSQFTLDYTVYCHPDSVDKVKEILANRKAYDTPFGANIANALKRIEKPFAKIDPATGGITYYDSAEEMFDEN